LLQQAERYWQIDISRYYISRYDISRYDISRYDILWSISSLLV